MSEICVECGAEIPGGSDFCHWCGRMRKAPAEGGAEIPAAEACPACGEEFIPGERFCRRCGGLRIDSVSVSLRLGRLEAAAILLAVVPGMLALVPGFVSVFGLGLLLLRRWSRAAVYLALSAMLGYHRLTSGGGLMYVVVAAFTVFVFLMHAAETAGCALSRRR
ncbi:MAG: zinc ribbon domain-containing protein [Candidatus Methanoplasma sp.]|jgi:hypothetical protein|nr:zinc ribbon domain-containing protein [Candidatus Methanoplasma sp.]